MLSEYANPGAFKTEPWDPPIARNAGNDEPPGREVFAIQPGIFAELCMCACFEVGLSGEYCGGFSQRRPHSKVWRSAAEVPPQRSAHTYLARFLDSASQANQCTISDNRSTLLSYQDEAYFEVILSVIIADKGLCRQYDSEIVLFSSMPTSVRDPMQEMT